MQRPLSRSEFRHDVVSVDCFSTTLTPLTVLFLCVVLLGIVGEPWSGVYCPSSFESTARGGELRRVIVLLAALTARQRGELT